MGIMSDLLLQTLYELAALPPEKQEKYAEVIQEQLDEDAIYLDR